MTETTTPADPRPFLARAVEVAAPVIAAVRADRYRDPTPCGDFDVEEAAGHLLFVARRVAGIGRGEDTFSGDEEHPTSDDWAVDWRAAGADAVTAWRDDATLAAEVVLPWTTESGAEALAMYVAELTIHTWDLASGLGVDVDWDDEVVEVGLAAIRREIPLAERAPIWEAFVASAPPGTDFSPPFADAVAVDGDAPAIDHLVAWSGRTP